MGLARFLTTNLLTSVDQITATSERGGPVGRAVKVAVGTATLETSGSYTGGSIKTFLVEIHDVTAGAEVGQALYRWRRNTSVGWEATGIATSAAFATLADGVQIKWTSAAGDDFGLGDYWTILVGVPFGRGMLVDTDRDTEWRSAAVGASVMLDVDLGSAQAVDAVALLDHNLTAGASILLLGSAATPAAPLTGSVTLANCRLSVAAGAAFADLTGVDLAACANGQRRLIITDSAGKNLMGWLKAPGTGVTYGAELLTNVGFASDTAGWTAQECTLASVAGGQAGNCLEITRVSGDNQMAKQTIAAQAAGAFYAMSAYVKSGTSGNEGAVIGFYDGSNPTVSVLATTSGSWVLVTVQGALDGTRILTEAILLKYTATAGTMLFDTVSLKQILTPSVTGATIVSARNGTTSAWASEDAGFLRNDPAGYTYWVDAAVYEVVPRQANDLVYYLAQPSTACRYWRVVLTDTGNPDGYLRASELYLGGYTELTKNFAPDPIRTSRAELVEGTGGLRTPRGILATSERITLDYRLMAAADRTAILALFEAVYGAERASVRPLILNWDSADPADVGLYHLETPELPITSAYLDRYDWPLVLVELPRLARSGI